MKHKIQLLFITVVMVVATVLSLSACTKNNGPVNNSELEEFREIVTSIRDGFEEESESVSAQTLNLTVQSEEIFDVLSEAPDKEITESMSFYKDVFDQTFMLPLVLGEAIEKFHNSEKFYGVGIALPQWDQYIKTESEGTVKSSYVFSAAGSLSDEEMYIYMSIDYKSEDDYTFYAVQTNRSLTNSLYLYGNSDREFLAVSYRPANGTQAADLYAQCKEKYKMGYIVRDEKTVENCFQLVREEFESLDFDKIAALGDEYDYSITPEEYKEVAEPYFGNTAPVTEPGEWTMDGDIVLGFSGSEGDRVLTVPSDARKMWAQLNLPATTEKLVIPSTIEEIVTTKDHLESLVNPDYVPKEEEGEPVYVSCPVEYFEIFLNDVTGTGREFLAEIEVEDGSPLFKVEDYCLYSTDGTLLYIPENDNITSLTLDSPVSETADRCCRSVDFPALKELTVTETGLDAANKILYRYLDNGIEKSISLDKLTVNIGDNAVDTDMYLSVDFPVKEIFINGSRDFSLNCGSHVQNIYVDLAAVFSVSNNNYIDSDNIEDLYGKIDNIEISENTLALNESVFCPVTVSMPYSLYDLINSGKYKNFLPSDLIVEDYDFKVVELKSGAWLGDTYIERIYTFRPMSAEEEKELELTKVFKNTHYFSAEESHYGVAYAHIGGYWGNESVINVPETIKGYPVYSFSLRTDSPSIDIELPTVEGVKELYLPSCLKRFFIEDYGDQRYSLERIVYEGTKEEFFAIIGNEQNQLYNILEYTDEIVCEDGIYTQQTDRESWMYEDGNGNALQIDIDWSRIDEGIVKEIQVALTTNNGNFYRAHEFDYNSTRLYFGINKEIEEGVLTLAYIIEFDLGKYNYNSSRNEIQNLSVKDDQYNEMNFTLVSTEEFKGTIAHDFSSKEVIDPNCWTGGYTTWTCSVCGIYGKTTDETPALGHDIDENGYCSRCGGNYYYAYTVTDDGAGNESVTITKLIDQTLTEINVPAELDGKPVTQIRDAAFMDCANLESVTLPDTIEIIEDDAFQGCTNLTYINMPKSIRKIDDSAFAGCTSLTSVFMPRDVGTIDIYYNAFSYSITIFYEGTRTEWKEKGNTMYSYIAYYSESNPYDGETESTEYTYWHYAEDGKTPIIWTQETI